ncbi:MAG: hypothetical protein IKP27_03425 [Paludibacteraceae bacterium]|nr:hypothetical protein [Paludibacteraceae bacterium]
MEEKMKSASDWQGGDRYPGIDKYEKVVLKPGHELCALVLIDDRGRVRPSEFLFPTRALRTVGDDAAELNRLLQVAPCQNKETAECTYKAVLASFRLREPIEFDKCVSTENTAYGKGGLAHYYLPLERFTELVDKGGLKRAKFGNECLTMVLNHYDLKPREFDKVNSRLKQLQYRRNLFCAQKAKLDTLDVIQNSPRDADVELAKRNLKKLDENISRFKGKIKDSVQLYGKVASPLYDELNRRLDAEIKCRERADNVLVLGNVKTEHSSGQLSEMLGGVSLNILAASEMDRVESVSQNLFRKIDDYGRRNLRNEIDVREQGLVDVMNINRINKECQKVMAEEALRPRGFQSMENIALPTTDGKHKEYRLDELFTEAAIQKIRSAQNGKLTEPLQLKDGSTAKLMMLGNKAHLYLKQPKESLDQTLDKMSLGDTERKRLLNGETIAYKNIHVKLDKDLNCVVSGAVGRLSPSAKAQPQAQKLPVPKLGNHRKRRGHSL